MILEFLAVIDSQHGEYGQLIIHYVNVWQFDTSPTQGRGKVQARSWARSGQGQGKVRARSRQGWGKVRARLGQGPGKVWTKSKVQTRSGQARSGQGSGKVRARLGQGLDKKQGSGKVGAISWDRN